MDLWRVPWLPWHAPQAPFLPIALRGSRGGVLRVAGRRLDAARLVRAHPVANALEGSLSSYA
jgi:hypothetical protein